MPYRNKPKNEPQSPRTPWWAILFARLVETEKFKKPIDAGTLWGIWCGVCVWSIGGCFDLLSFKTMLIGFVCLSVAPLLHQIQKRVWKLPYTPNKWLLSLIITWSICVLLTLLGR